MTEKIKGGLTVQLYDNMLASDPTDRVGKILLRNSLELEDLAREVEPLVEGVRFEKIVGVMHRMVEVAISRVADGFAVDFGVCHICPSITGTFPENKPEFNPEVNALFARYSQTLAMRRGLENAKVKVDDKTIVGPVISQVEDMKTREINTLITPLKNLCVRGSHIRIAGENPANGIRFVAVNCDEVIEVPVDDVVINDPSTVLIMVPALSDGEYYLEITTQYAGRNKTVKEPLTCRFEQVLTVIA